MLPSIARWFIALHHRLVGAQNDPAVVTRTSEGVIRDEQVTPEQLHAEAEQLAQELLGTTAELAYARLAAGEFAHTAFASRMDSIKWLLNEPCSEPPLAAE